MIPSGYFRLLFIAFSALFIISCYDEAPEPVEPREKKTRYLSQILENGDVVQSFFYDDKNRLVAHEAFPEGIRTYIEYKYRNDFWPDSMLVYKEFRNRSRLVMRVVLEYEDAMLIRSWALSPDNAYIIFDDRYDYDSFGRIVHLDQRINFFGLPAQMDYIWEGENVTKIITRTPRSTYIYEFEFDKQRNPYQEVYASIGFDPINRMPVSQSNWIETMHYYEGDKENALIYSSKYAFSYGGYPFYVATEHTDFYGVKHDVRQEYQY